MKTTAFLSAMILAAACCAAAAAPAFAEPFVPDPAFTENAEEPIMTMPVQWDVTVPEPELYGFCVETPEVTLNVGETYQLKTAWDADCYYAESLQFKSDNGKAASVSNDGVITAQADGTAIIRITAKLNPEKVSLSQQVDLVRTITAAVTVIDSTLTAEQKAALEQLEKKENRMIGEFRRERAVIKGILAPDAPRMTLDEINQIIEDSVSFDEIMQKIAAAQAFPDYFGGSGVTLIEYWFDDAGTEKILVTAEQSQIDYFRLNENGSILESRDLYPAGQQNTQTFHEKMAVFTYRIFNSISINGDANCDESIDVADAVLIARFAAEDSDAAMTDQGRQNADVTHDGNVDGQDTTKILQYIAKKISLEDLAQ